MNALVAVRSNATGIDNVTPDKRAEAANEISSNVLAKAAAMNGTAKADAATNTTTDTASRAVGDTLDKNAFMQLLVLQMQNQDPTSPMDDSQMIAQLAQFSSLEQMTNLNTSFTNLKSDIDQLNFITTNDLLGKTIIGQDASGNAVQGTVDKVLLQNGAISLIVGNSTVPVGNVLQIN